MRPAASSGRSPGSRFKGLTIDAGYRDGHGIIFKGNIIQGLYGRESPTDTLTTVTAADGDHGHNFAVVSTKHEPGSTPQDHFNTALQALGQFGITKGISGSTFRHRNIRAPSRSGAWRPMCCGKSRNRKMPWFFFDREQVTMIPRTGSHPDGAIVLNSETGLIGMPTQTTDGIFARCLINPAIRRGSTVQINQADIQGAVAEISPVGKNDIGLGYLASIAADGLYTVIKIDIVADTRGNEWYMDLAMWAKGTTPPKTNLLPYNLGSEA
jgi:hypothetical protein